MTLLIHVSSSNVYTAIDNSVLFYSMYASYCSRFSCLLTTPLSFLFTPSVAHRLSSIVHCDSIIVMAKGQVVEKGTHQQLMKSLGVYARMWEAQNGEALDRGVDVDQDVGDITINTPTDSFENGGDNFDSSFSGDGSGIGGSSFSTSSIKCRTASASQPSGSTSSESLASLVIDGGCKGLTWESMEPVNLMRSTAREDRLGFIGDMRADTQNHGYRTKSVLDSNSIRSLGEMSGGEDAASALKPTDGDSAEEQI